MKGYLKAVSIAVLFVFILQSVTIAAPITTTVQENNTSVNQTRMLKTKGNKIVLADDESVEIHLTGVNDFDYLEKSHNLERSAMEAFDNWHSNIIRLPVQLKDWAVDANKKEIQRVIQMASDRGKYVILDLHHFRAINQDQLNFWKEAAVLYKNNPTVLFGIFNEPHDITWKQWRDGGGDMVTEGSNRYVPIGHQKVVETIRDLGAQNIIVAAGLDWGYDLRGIVGESEGDPTIYALVDQGSHNNAKKVGNGIVYDTHIYPTKGLADKWDKMIGTARKKYPLISGENGWDADTIKVIMNTVFEPGSDMYYTNWNAEFFKFVNDTKTYGAPLNYTSWCFHPGSSPRILADRPEWNLYDYSYRPTDYWGVDVQNELNKDFGNNLLTRKTIVNSSDNNFARLATDGDYDTMWKYDGNGDKFIEIDLGSVYVINKWAIRHAGTNSYQKEEQLKNTVDFRIKGSLDGVTWFDVDSVTGNKAPVTERTVKDFSAKYIRFEFTKASQMDNTLRIQDLFVTGYEIAS